MRFALSTPPSKVIGSVGRPLACPTVTMDPGFLALQGSDFLESGKVLAGAVPQPYEARIVVDASECSSTLSAARRGCALFSTILARARDEHITRPICQDCLARLLTDECY